MVLLKGGIQELFLRDMGFRVNLLMFISFGLMIWFLFVSVSVFVLFLGWSYCGGSEGFLRSYFLCCTACI